jgi:uncharacterized protein (DUF608 family)
VLAYNEQTGGFEGGRTSRGFPMGGIGSGGFRVLTDGGFGEFRTNNNWFRTPGRSRYPRGTFLSLRAQSDSRTVSRMLRGSYADGREFRNVTEVLHTSFRGEIPSFTLEFSDPALPVHATLSGFTALIPHNPKDSSIPGAFFSVNLNNPGSEELRISLLISFENLLGLGGSGTSPLYFPLDGAVTYRSLRGNYAEEVRGSGYTGLAFRSRRDYGVRNPRRRVVGEYLLFTDEAVRDFADLSVVGAWRSSRRRPPLLREFARGGTVGDRGSARGSRTVAGKGNAGAICLDFVLAPGVHQTVPFYLLWWTPYHVVETRQRLRRLTGRHRGTDFGHYYQNFFAGPDELASYMVRERSRLQRESEEVPALLKASTLPDWLRRYVLNSTDAVLTNTVLPRDGTLHTIEAVPWGWPFGGLTGTMDQRLAAHPYTAAFFPGLNRSELRSFLSLTREGRVPHGNGNVDIALGTNSVPYGDPIKSFNETDVWTDLPQSLILQLGKDILEQGDRSLLRQVWPRFLEMKGYLDRALQNAIPEGITTYDYMHYHPSFVYSAILHAATLRMLLRLAELLPALEETLEELRRELQETLAATDEFLWDDRGFYRTCQGRDTVFTSALAGDWFLRFSGLEPVVPFAKARSHSEWQSRVLVDAYPFMDSRAGRSRPLVYREADPEGREMPAIHRGARIYRVNNPWQSIAYQGLEAIYLGRVNAGLQLLQRIWDKGWHEGYPWDMDHWGMRGRTYMTHPILWIWDMDHFSSKGHTYMTHPSSWAVCAALTGVSYDAFARRLTVSPRLHEGWSTYRVPAFLPDVWLVLDSTSMTANTHAGKPENLTLRVAKHFGEPKVVDTLRLYQASGSYEDIDLKQSLELREGNEFSVPIGAAEPEQ